MAQRIAAFETQWKADLTIAMLRENGLHPFDLSIAPNVFYYGAEHSYFVTIPDEELKEAIGLIISNGDEKYLL